MTDAENRPLVVITTNKDRPVDLDLVSRHIGDVAEIRTIELMHRMLSPEEEDAFIAKVRDASVLFLRPGRITRRMIEGMPKLRAISIFGAGLNQVDVAACNDRGVMVINAPGGNAQAVAELTFGILLSLLRRIPNADRKVRAGQWQDAGHIGSELHGKTLGIVGIGQIGMRVARIAGGFDMTLLAYDPGAPASRFPEVGAREVSLAQLMANSDVVTLHAPLLPVTEGMIGAGEIAAMKPSAVLVNAARGGLVDEPALLRALKENKIAGAALDAFATEPLPADSPFLTMKNVVLTPHDAAQTRETLPKITTMVSSDIRRVLVGERPVNLANPEMLENSPG